VVTDGHGGRRRRGRHLVLAVAAAIGLVASGTALAVLWKSRGAPAGRPRIVTDRPLSLPAAFAERSYGPGAHALLRVTSWRGPFTVQILHVGPERVPTRSNEVVHGVAIGRTVRVAAAPHAQLPRELRLEIGAWPTGVYFARLSAPGGRFGFAPFVLRPRRLGQAKVAVVLPTNTWQAYNFRDVNGDGVGDTWYADPSHSVDLTRAFLDHGVPLHFRGYQLGFLRWLASTHRQVDFLSDDDLERVQSGRSLARLYDLVVFSGHEEYVTTHVYDVVESYRNLGGNLAFLSANNFFYRVDREGSLLRRTGRWRDLGRPESRLIGVQSIGWNENRFPNEPFVAARGAPLWFLGGTGIHLGSHFGRYGIEVDARTSESPAGTTVLARIPNIFGRGRTAEMTYYRTVRGAKVFAAGAMNFGGSADWPVVSRLLRNVWSRVASP